MIVRLPRAFAAEPPTPVPGSRVSDSVVESPASRSPPSLPERRSDGRSRASRRGEWLAWTSASPRVHDGVRPVSSGAPWTTPPRPGWSAVKPSVERRSASRSGRHRRAEPRSRPSVPRGRWTRLRGPRVGLPLRGRRRTAEAVHPHQQHEAAARRRWSTNSCRRSRTCRTRMSSRSQAALLTEALNYDRLVAEGRSSASRRTPRA